MQSQPEDKGAMVGVMVGLDAVGAMVGVMVGLDAVGARVTGAAVGAGVGFDGQLIMPSLNAHSASASDC